MANYNVNEGDVLRVTTFGSSNGQAVNNSWWFYVGRDNPATPVTATLIGSFITAFDTLWQDVVVLLGASYETHKAHYDKMFLAKPDPLVNQWKLTVTNREIDLYAAGALVGGVAGAELPLLATVSGAKQAHENYSVTGRFSLSPIPESATDDTTNGSELKDANFDAFKQALDPLVWNGFTFGAGNGYAYPCVMRKKQAESTGPTGTEIDYASRSYGILLGHYIGSQNTRKIRRSLA